MHTMARPATATAVPLLLLPLLLLLLSRRRKITATLTMAMIMVTPTTVLLQPLNLRAHTVTLTTATIMATHTTQNPRAPITDTHMVAKSATGMVRQRYGVVQFFLVSALFPPDDLFSRRRRILTDMHTMETITDMRTARRRTTTTTTTATATADAITTCGACSFTFSAMF
eukprot:m.464058 g.464058  ORF g.464058 m.464058 type:complete len:170 (+) comp57045_c1_seq6:719-1228(+)